MLTRIVVFVLLLGGMLFSACVPVRKQTYLQERRNELQHYPKDTVVKKFTAEEYIYKLQPGDVVSVRITSLTPEEWDFFQKSNPGASQNGQQDPLLSGYVISEEGAIQLPVVGSVAIAGLSIIEANQHLQQQVAQYLKNPTVHIKLLNFNYTLLGEVNTQGTFTTYDPRLNILQAVGRAGGLSEFADRANVKVVRKIGEEVEIAFVNLLDDDVITSPYFYLRPDDVVVVRPLKAKTFNNFTARNISLGLSVISILSILYLRF
ncbi:polysaccharide biosynthesis/export family protein [Cesiribacter sp. SM1]|uniref:polysaccharide biosynthesis/export family protein n=1 Tax=Cesiribacter sp. SM1 TaxID=2861196 RepID=UPI001CD43D19|nr:polysaccharide biosynthesis/export family protein [Cesiribacter sp. SM1]